MLNKVQTDLAAKGGTWGGEPLPIATIFPLHPAIGAIKAQLYAAGAVYAAMSGSGSAVFGLFDDEPSLPDFTDCFVWQGKLQ